MSPNNPQGFGLLWGAREIVEGDVTACIFWLKNRRPDLWRNNRGRQVPTPLEFRDADKEPIAGDGDLYTVPTLSK